MEDVGRSTAKVLSALRFAKEFLRRVDGDFRIVTLHPGGGQYDCFSICDENSPLVMINYNGTSAVGLGLEFQDAWRRIEENPEYLAKEFAASADKHEQNLDSTPRVLAIVDSFISKIEQEFSESWNLEWGYIDSPYDVSENLPSDILLPESWKTVTSLSPEMYGWQANILLLYKNRQIVAIANQATGEILA